MSKRLLLVAALVAMIAAVPAQAQVSTLFRAAAGLMASAGFADRADAETAEPAEVPVFVTYSLVLPDSEQVMMLPEGTILPFIAAHCPDGWDHYQSEETGEQMFIPFGVMMDNELNLAGVANTDPTLLPACVKQW